MNKTEILVTITHAKPLPDKTPITDIAAQRIYGFLYSQGVEAGVDARIWTEVSDSPKCRKCGGGMTAGIAIESTLCGMPDFPGGEVVTVSPGGPGRVIDCLKCGKCGHSVTEDAK